MMRTSTWHLKISVSWKLSESWKCIVVKHNFSTLSCQVWLFEKLRSHYLILWQGTPNHDISGVLPRLICTTCPLQTANRTVSVLSQIWEGSICTHQKQKSARERLSHLCTDLGNIAKNKMVFGLSESVIRWFLCGCTGKPLTLVAENALFLFDVYLCLSSFVLLRQRMSFIEHYIHLGFLLITNLWTPVFHVKINSSISVFFVPSPCARDSWCFHFVCRTNIF